MVFTKIKANKLFPKNLIETGLFVGNPNNIQKQKFNILVNFRLTQTTKWSVEFGRFQDLKQLKISPRRLKLQQIETVSFVLLAPHKNP